MKLKNIFKNIAVLSAMPISGTLSGISLLSYFDDTLKYMDPTSLPENGVGIIILPFAGFIFSVFLVVVLGMLIFGLRKDIKLSCLWYHKSERKSVSIDRLIGYIAVFGLIYEGIRDWLEYKVFLVSGLLFYACSIVFIIVLTLTVCSLIFKETENNPPFI